MALPHYLTSGASSRAHYAFLRRLEGTGTLQEADRVVEEEVGRCREVLLKEPSPSRVADTLIILLHCSTLATCAFDDGFALLPALKLAEGGGKGGLRERRLGYRYLTERMPPGHELGLLLVNTVRKDLASEDEAHILLALSAITSLPSPELAPAVLPLLSSKVLLEHEHPSVRLRTLAALSALAVQGEEFPLSLRQLGKLIRHEDDPSVLAGLLRAFTAALEGGSRELDASRRRKAYDSVFVAAARHAEGGPIASIAVKAVTAIVRVSAGDELEHHISEQAQGLLEQVGEGASLPPPPDQSFAGSRSLLSSPRSQAWQSLHVSRGSAGAGPQPHLLEACALAAALYELSGHVDADPLLGHLRRLLVPRVKGKSSRSPSKTVPKAELSANTHVFVLRCLSLLPPAVSQPGLREEHMAAIMGGIDAEDPTIRRATLRLLAREDASLLDAALQRHLGKCRGNDVSGRTDAAGRAAEVVEIRSEGLPDRERARALVDGVTTISRALEGIWVDGVRLLGGLMRAGSTEFKRAVVQLSAQALMKESEQTLVVALATVACEFPCPADAPAVVRAIMGVLPNLEPSVQEIGMLAIGAQLSLVPERERGSLVDEVLRALDSLKAKSVKHIAMRCTQLSLVLEQGSLERLQHRTLEAVLTSVLEIYAEATAASSSPKPSLDSSTIAPRKKADTGLKYSYAQPKSQPRSKTHTPTPRSPGSASSGSGRDGKNHKVRSPGVRSPRSPLERAAELADFRAMGRSMLAEDDLAMDELRLGGR